MATPELAHIVHGYGSGRKCLAEGRVIWVNTDLIKFDRIANYTIIMQQNNKGEEPSYKKKRLQNISLQEQKWHWQQRSQSPKPVTSTTKDVKQSQSKHVRNKQFLKTVVEETEG